MRLALLAIGAEANNGQTEAWPSQKRIAQRAQLVDRTLRRVLPAAESGGWIKTRRAKKSGRAWCYTIYTFTAPDDLMHHIPEHPWNVDPDWRRPDTVAPATPPRGDAAVSGRDGVGSPERLPSTRAADIRSREADTLGSRADSAGRGPDTAASGDDRTRLGPTTFPSYVPQEAPKQDSTHGPRRTARAGPSDRIREDDPEVQRRRREANRLVEELAARARR